MIIAELRGGLGNQLFQWAAGLAAADRLGCELKIDDSYFQRDSTDTKRKFDLQWLQNPPHIATKSDLLFATNTIKNHFLKLLPTYKRYVYKEANFEYDENFLKIKEPIFIKGYRQSYLYFHHLESRLQNQVEFQPSVVPNLEKIAKKIAETPNAVAVHVRRGDYASAELLAYHGLLPDSYYKQAFTAMKSKVQQPHYFLFSDDNTELATWLGLAERQYTLVSGLYTNNHFEDFSAMKLCKHAIIGNSTFSWWGAYLIKNSQKIVIAPQQWFGSTGPSSRTMHPPTWQLL